MTLLWGGHSQACGWWRLCSPGLSAVGVQVLTRTGAWPSTRESTSTGTGEQPGRRPGHLTDCLLMAAQHRLRMQPAKLLPLAVACP